jgi:dihydrofolate synthase/folylpolyglutamate synthase
MSYLQTIEYLFSQLPVYHQVGSSAYKPNLDNTITLCNLLGNPQKKFRSVHVAGTNGKGSVSHMLASILQNTGLRVGLFTSPHLRDFRERIRVNGKKISRSYVNAFVKRYQGDFEKIQPSFFEVTVGLAFQYFRDQQADVAVVETGLGGRLDSTNIISPLLSIITNVSYDHMQLLGNTLEQIAVEKAGIIKPGVPLIIGETQKEIQEVFCGRAKKVKSAITFADQVYSAANIRMAGKRSRNLVMDIFRKEELFIRHLSSSLPGLYQVKNIVTVMSACEVMNGAGFSISRENIRSGIREVFRKTGLQGRWHVLSWKPLTICDTGHNEGGLKGVIGQIGITPHDHLHFLFGVVNDKEVDKMLEMLPRQATYYFCKANIPRGLDASELAKKGMEFGLKGKAYPSVKSAFHAAMKKASGTDLIFVGGSIFIVAEVI